MMAVFGFDFGTTNSVAAVVNGDAVLSFLDNDQPIPSVISFEGGKVEVGRKARERLASSGLGVQGSTVRSPKSLLGKQDLIIDGIRRDPVKMVEYVVGYVRDFVLKNKAAKGMDMDRVVATIPVNMDGQRRGLLRQAFRQAGMSIVQFVHEPLAALYGYLRTSENGSDLIKRYEDRLLLVFDWGGGTLDLTLCRILDGMLVQVANDGTDEVGGDIFDEELRNEVARRSLAEKGLNEDVPLLPDARKRLLHACEQAKISLSQRGSWNVYVENYYDIDGDADLEVKLARDDLEKIIGHLVRKGVQRIERLLEREGFSTASVELCLATGGMVNMPLVKNRLDELFGPGRVQISGRSALAIAEGAAWVAHDEAQLHLAKNIELVLARNSYVALLEAGLEMPSEGEQRQERFSLYCVDPSDGFGKFSIVSPHRPGPLVWSYDDRRNLANLLLKVDRKAAPFRERLELQISINEDLVLRAEAWSLNQKGRAVAEVHDLEFALATPGSTERWLKTKIFDSSDECDSMHDSGSLSLRSNLATRKDPLLVPGEVLYRFDPYYFRVDQDPPRIQVEERLYYEPCAVCRRASNDPLCRCSSGINQSTRIEARLGN